MAWPTRHGSQVVWAAPGEAVRRRLGESLSRNHTSRESFLSDLTLDTPEALGDLAADPLIHEDYLILSTIHSAKGQDWDVV